MTTRVLVDFGGQRSRFQGKPHRKQGAGSRESHTGNNRDYTCLGFRWAKEQVPGKATQETTEGGLKKNITVFMRLVDCVMIHVMVVNHYLFGYFGRVDWFPSDYFHRSFFPHIHNGILKLSVYGSPHLLTVSRRIGCGCHGLGGVSQVCLARMQGSFI